GPDRRPPSCPPDRPYDGRGVEQPAGARRRRRGGVPARRPGRGDRHPCRAARQRSGVPRRGDPRDDRADRGERMSVQTALPVADARALGRSRGALARRHPKLLWGALSLHVAAALTALAAPRLLGGLVQAVEDGTTVDHVDKVAIALAVFLVAQTV